MKKVSCILVMLVMLVSLIGCKPAEPGTTAVGEPATAAAASDKEPFVFTTALSVMPSSLDPTNLNGAGDMNTSRTLYEPLVDEVRGETELMPWLATSWDTPDASTYIFHLREGVKFHDGSVMTADDVVYTFERCMALSTTVSSCVSEIETVTSPDANTVEITLKADNSGFLYNVAKIGIISKAWCLANETDGDWAVAYLVKHACGTGAYALSEYVDDQYVTLTAFPDYWGGWKDGQIDVFRTVVVGDSATQVQMLCNGEVDKLQIPITEYMDQIKASNMAEVLVAGSLQTNIFTFNMGKFPFNNEKVREAVTYAFDYEAAKNKVYNGYGTVPSGFMSANFADHNPDIPQEKQDMEKAKALIAEADIGTCDIAIHLCEGSNDQLLMAQILQGNLAELGINLKIEVVPWTTMAEEHTSSETAPEMAALNMGAFTGDAVYYLATNFETGGIYNWSFYSDDAFDTCIKTARASSDPAVRTKELYTAQQLIVDDFAALWCASPDSVEVMSNRIADYEIHPLDYYYSIRPYNLTQAQ